MRAYVVGLGGYLDIVARIGNIQLNVAWPYWSTTNRAAAKSQVSGEKGANQIRLRRWSRRRYSRLSPAASMTSSTWGATPWGHLLHCLVLQVARGSRQTGQARGGHASKAM